VVVEKNSRACLLANIEYTTHDDDVTCQSSKIAFES